MKFADKINRFVHPFFVNRICKTYRTKLKRVRQCHPELFKPIDSFVLDKHRELWNPLGLGVCTDWVVWLSNLSGLVDYRYCPEDLLYGRIERVLNDCDRAGFGCEDKNQFFLYVPHELQAKTYLRFVRGCFYDEEYHWISERIAQSILDSDHGDIIGKVCVNSLGGHGISKFSYQGGGYISDSGEKLTTDWIKRSSYSYIIQEKIEQCDFSAQFNPYSANSCKIVTLRCPWSGAIKIVKAGMRFGVTESVFDNLSSGGVSVCVDINTGMLSGPAYNWFRCTPFEQHPSTGVRFSGSVHPNWCEMRDVVIKCAERVPDMNMLSWDVLVDRGGRVKILEVNASSQSSDWLQFAFGPLFGKETENLVDWIARNRQYDNFNHFRSFY